MYPVTPEYIALSPEEIEKARILSSPGDPLTEENVCRLSLVENGVDIFEIRGGAGLSRARSDTSTGLSAIYSGVTGYIGFAFKSLSLGCAIQKRRGG